jgi:uncharacterized SAM-binding protein YcdF (DUF218 family)
MSKLLIICLKLLAIPLYPAGFVFTMVLAGLILFFLNKTRTAVFAFLLGMVALLLFSTPLLSYPLLASLEQQYLPAKTYPQASAIVVLGGSGLPPNPPRIYPETNDAADRLLYAARIFKQGYAPYLITSGTCVTCLTRNSLTAAEIEARLLIDPLGIDSAKIIKDNKARTTREHGMYLDSIFRARNWPKTLIVVTSASHMPRSVAVFKRFGFTVYPAPTDYAIEKRGPSSIEEFFPNVDALMYGTRALHEIYGMWGYKLWGLVKKKG